MASLIYTSGTSGHPRGVMLPHRAVLTNCEGAYELMRPLQLKDEVYLSFLPLSHSYEHTVGQFFLPQPGLRRWSIRPRPRDTSPSDMAAVKPTILTHGAAHPGA